MTIGQAYKSLWCNAVDYLDRASRSEYWWNVLINQLIVIGLVLAWLRWPRLAMTAGLLYGLAVLVPGTCLFFRRMNDAGITAPVSIGYVTGRELVAGAMIREMFTGVFQNGSALTSVLMLEHNVSVHIGLIAVMLAIYLIIRACGLVALCLPSRSRADASRKHKSASVRRKL